MLTAWTIREINELRDETRRSADVLTPQMLRTAEMELTLTRISLQAGHAILSRTTDELQGAVGEIGRQAKRLDELSSEFESAISTERNSRDEFTLLFTSIQTMQQINKHLLSLT
ncbi:MAG: hypothetical protein HEQ37_18715 [Acidovorax sp.]|nr:hypothetical protein [Acidovorax sp.]